MAWCDVCDRYVGEGGMKYVQKDVTPRSLKTDFNKNTRVLDDLHEPSFPSDLSQERGGIIHPTPELPMEPIPIVIARPATPIPVINIDQDQRREHARGPDDVAWDPVPPPPRG